MASSNVRTSSEALTNLQTDLSALSEELHQTYNLMYDYMMKVGEFWQDRKYEEFVEDYQPKIEKCDEIATRYEEWCKKVLQPVIERAHEAENVNVGVDGGGPGAGGPGAGGPGTGGSGAGGPGAGGPGAGGSGTGGSGAGGPGAGGPGAGGPGTGGPGTGGPGTGGPGAGGPGIGGPGPGDPAGDPGDNNINMASGNPQSGTTDHDPKMESLFYKTFPDIPSDSGIAEAYLKMSPDERGEFNAEYMRLQGMRDDALFHAQDRMKMGTEMRKGGIRSPGFFWTARGMEEAADADKNYKDGLRQLGEKTLEEAGMKPHKPTTKIVPIANGCGPASGSASGFFAKMGQAIDSYNTANREGIPLHDAHDYHEESCNIHDKCYYSGEPKEKCDMDFQRRSGTMGWAVSNASWKSGPAYEQAQKDRQLSEALRPTWEKEHPGQKFDEENFRIVPNNE